MSAATGDARFKLDEAEYRSLVADGFHESNADKLARKAPYRVTQGFGYFVNCATLAEAKKIADEWAAKWDDELCAPHVIDLTGGDAEYRPITRYQRERGEG